MPTHQKAFWAMTFFLTGVLIASSFFHWRHWLIILFGVWLLIVGGLLLAQRFWLALLSIGFLVGFIYYGWHDALAPRLNIEVLSHRPVVAMVIRSSVNFDQQVLVAKLVDFKDARIQITAPMYPEYVYGDVIRVEGGFRASPASGYYRKEGIGAVVRLPQLELIGRNDGSPVLHVLFGFRKSILSALTSSLSPDQAAFLGGLILGRSVGFSQELRDEFKATGTTHLVALSGYNVSIIVLAVAGLLGFWFSRRIIFGISALTIVAFVLMTGAEASVVRAAIMGVILLVSERAGRPFLMRNAITLAATVMVILNPHVLLFDVGFQLSFFAFLGIVYLQPAIISFFHLSLEPGVFGWRKNLITTTAAQLMVLPLLLYYFGFFSPISFITNLLIIGFIPYTMLFGPLIYLGHLISPLLGIFISLPARVLLGYELGVIHFFSQVSLGLSFARVPVLVIGIYYGFLGWFMYVAHRRVLARGVYL
jgi:competence protein ComEC